MRAKEMKTTKFGRIKSLGKVALQVLSNDCEIAILTMTNIGADPSAGEEGQMQVAIHAHGDRGRIRAALDYAVRCYAFRSKP